MSPGEGTGGIALLAAIFAANFPEAVVVAPQCALQGPPTVSSWASGRSVPCCWSSPWLSVPDHGGLNPENASLPLAFAAGAVLAALADLIMAEPMGMAVLPWR